MARMLAADGPRVDLAVPLSTVCAIIQQARQVAEEETVENPDTGWTIAEETESLDEAGEDDERDDPLLQDLEGLIDGLTVDAQVDLVALMWLGRDGAGLGDWTAVRADAADVHDGHAARYLTGSPLLADQLTEGLALLGFACES